MNGKQSEYVVSIDSAAIRDLKKMPKKVQAQILELSKSLATEPRPEGVESLTLFKGLYRVRMGNYRIVYSIEDNRKLVIVAAIADRKHIYLLLENRCYN